MQWIYGKIHHRFQWKIIVAAHFSLWFESGLDPKAIPSLPPVLQPFYNENIRVKMPYDESALRVSDDMSSFILYVADQGACLETLMKLLCAFSSDVSVLSESSTQKDCIEALGKWLCEDGEGGITRLDSFKTDINGKAKFPEFHRRCPRVACPRHSQHLKHATQRQISATTPIDADRHHRRLLPAGDIQKHRDPAIAHPYSVLNAEMNYLSYTGAPRTSSDNASRLHRRDAQNQVQRKGKAQQGLGEGGTLFYLTTRREQTIQCHWDA
jgi:hypothetical protein